MPELRFQNTRVDLPDLPPDDGRPLVVIYFCVYGETFIRRFLDFYVRTHLAPNNLPWLARRARVLYLLATRPQDVDRLRDHPIRPAVEAHATVAAVPVRGASPDAITLSEAADAFFAIANHLRPSRPDAVYILLSPDSLWCDGALRFAYRMMDANTTGVYIPHFVRVVAEDAIAGLPAGDEPIRLSSAALVRLAAAHLHPETEIYRADPHRRLSAEYQATAFVEVPGEGYAARSMALHPMALRATAEFEAGVGTLESALDALPPAWAGVRVLSGRLLHVDCAPRGAAPRYSHPRPFRFDDFAQYRAQGATGPITRHLWKFHLTLPSVPVGRRTPAAWAAAFEQLEELAERAVLFARVMELEYLMIGQLAYLRTHLEGRFQQLLHTRTEELEQTMIHQLAYLRGHLDARFQLVHDALPTTPPAPRPLWWQRVKRVFTG